MASAPSLIPRGRRVDQRRSPAAAYPLPLRDGAGLPFLYLAIAQHEALGGYAPELPFVIVREIFQ